MDLKRGFQLGPWEVHPLTGEITTPAGSVHLEPKVIEVLLVLAERPREVVEREDLLQRVWGSRAAVSDEPLTRCIAELRRALGDSRQAPMFIQTIAKRGYRLLVPIDSLSTALAQPPAAAAPLQASSAAASAVSAGIAQPAADVSGRESPPPAGAPWLTARYFGLLAASVLLAIVIGGIGWQRFGPAPLADDGSIGPDTIAVLPFLEVGDSGERAYFGEGLADEILNRLSAVDGLRVVARTSSFALRASSDVRDISERLRVAHVLEGTVRRNGNQVRIGVRLVDARRGYQIWSASYDGVLDDIFALQDEIANTVVAKLRATVATVSAPARFTRTPPTSNFAAYELLLRGRQYLNRRDEEPLRRSISLFRQAIALDPGYGQAYVELAKAYVLLPSYSSELQDEMYDLALATLATGIDRDPSLDSRTQSVLALIASSRWDWIAAEVAFRRALEQSPTDPDLLVWYSQFLSGVGKPAASAEYAKRAKESDLLSPVVNHRLSVASMWIDDDAEAVRYARIAEELGMGPTATPDSYIVLKLRTGEFAAVRPLLIGVQTMFARPTAWVDPLLEALASPARRPAAVEAIANAARAREIPRKYLFGAWVYLGETDRALEAALALVNDRPSFDVEFIFTREARALRAHPRFGELVRAIGLNRYWDQFGWPEMCAKNGEEIVCH